MKKINKSKGKNWAVLPYNVSRIDSNNYLLSTPLSTWSILKKSQFRKLHNFSLNEAPSLIKRLKDEGLLIDEKNLNSLEEGYRRINLNLFHGVGLHIAVVSNQCNFNCIYCQTKSEKEERMNSDVASGILRFLLSGNHPAPHLEFQGGEPLLNWEIVEGLTRSARRYNEEREKQKKDLKISLVSNLSLLDDKKMKFLLDNDVDICTSLDGPAKVHNKNRVFKNGAPTYKKVSEKIKKINREYKRRKSKRRVNLLPTITRQSLRYAKEIIDEYVNWGVRGIAIRAVNKLGRADAVWEKIGYTPEEFNDFWEECMDYILELNRKGMDITERMALVMLKKIFKKEDPAYVDLCSPCGAGRNVLSYMPNGDIYSCDEARMIKSNLFKLGNVLKNRYNEILRKPDIFYICQSSLLDFWDYNSAYAIWSGTCPVLNFYEQGSTVVKIRQTSRYKISEFQFKYLFKKIAKDPDALKIFERWIGVG